MSMLQKIQRFCIHKVLITITLFSILAVPLTPAFEVQKAEAITTAVIADLKIPIQLKQLWAQIQSAYNAAQEIYERNQSKIAMYLANIMLSAITDSIIRWINSGFKGSPSFITDPTSFFLGVADKELGKIINELGAGFLCSPFKLDIQLSLMMTYYAKRDYQPECTLTKVVNNIENFLSGDFTQGGWDGWFHTFASTDNNPNSALLRAETELGVRIKNAQGQELSLLNWGAGFFSFRSCTNVAGSSEQKCDVSTPGKVLENQLNSSFRNGQERLIVADKIDMIIAAAFAQLVPRIISGAAGLLGYGSSGVRNEITTYENSATISAGSNPYEASLEQEEEAVKESQEILDIINAMELMVAAQCNGDVSPLYSAMPSLDGMRLNAEAIIIDSTNTIQTLTECRDEFNRNPQLSNISGVTPENCRTNPETGLWECVAAQPSSSSGFDWSQCPTEHSVGTSVNDQISSVQTVSNLRYGSPNYQTIAQNAVLLGQQDGRCPLETY